MSRAFENGFWSIALVLIAAGSARGAETPFNLAGDRAVVSGNVVHICALESQPRYENWQLSSG
jgi:hypothetical protein